MLVTIQTGVLHYHECLHHSGTFKYTICKRVLGNQALIYDWKNGPSPHNCVYQLSMTLLTSSMLSKRKRIFYQTFSASARQKTSLTGMPMTEKSNHNTLNLSYSAKKSFSLQTIVKMRHCNS